MKSKSLANNAWMFFIIILMGIVYQISNTYEYVDGDDATSIAYHLMGRDKILQPPYSSYHGMMDKALSILPPREELIRKTALGITRYANILMIVLILLLAFDWLQSHDRNITPAWRAFISVIVLLAVPEIFYLGLVYSPTLVAMCFVLCAHLLLRQSYSDGQKSKNIRFILQAGALILFGLGVAFRWNVVAYGLVIVIDLLMMQTTSEPIRNRMLQAAGWGILALVSSLAMINLSGYGLADIFGKFDTVLYVINQTGVLSSGDSVPFTEVLMRSGLTISPMLTPVFGIFVLIGFMKLAWDRNKLAFIALAGFLSILPWIKSGVPKFIITFLPLLIFAFIFGLVFFLERIKHTPYKIFIYSFLFLGLLFPWLVGIRVNREETVWGPGFELKSPTAENISKMQFQIIFAPGMAFPTPEGPRALYGHAYVLLGKWNEFINDLANERQNAINVALKLDLPLVVIGWSPDYYLDNLYSMGFKTSDRHDQTAMDDYFVERRFTNSQGAAISALFHEVEEADIPELISHLEKYPYSQKILLIGEPQEINTLYKNYSDILQVLGTTSAIMDITQLKAR